MRVKKWTMRALSLLIALVLIAPVELLSISSAQTTADVELTLGIEEILGALARDTADREEGYVLERSATVTVLDGQDQVAETYIDNDEGTYASVALDQAIGRFVGALVLPEAHSDSVLLRKALMEALEGKVFVKAFSDPDAVVVIDPDSGELQLFVVNPTDNPTDYSLSVTDARGQTLTMEDVSMVVRRTEAVELTEEQLADYRSRGIEVEVIAVTEKTTEEQVAREPRDKTAGGAAGGGGGSAGGGAAIEPPVVPDEDLENKDKDLDEDTEDDEETEDLDGEEDLDADNGDEANADSDEDAEIGDEAGVESNADEASDEVADGETESAEAPEAGDEAGESAFASMLGRIRRPTLMQVGGGEPGTGGDDADDSDVVDDEVVYDTVITTERVYLAVVGSETTGRAGIEANTLVAQVPAGSWAMVALGYSLGDRPAGEVYVYFDPMNGDVYDPALVEANGLVAEPENPRVPDDMAYFKGWFTEDADADADPFDFGTVITESITLYARYSDTFFVLFKNFSGSDSRVVETQLIPKGGTATYVNPDAIDGWVTPEGSVFVYWYEDNIDTNPGLLAFNFDDPIERNLELAAKFSTKYVVTFVSDGTQVEPLMVDHNTAIPAWPAPAPTRTGYTFSHWSATPGGEAFDIETIITEDMALYAVWAPAMVDYEIVYWLEKPNIDDPGTDTANYGFHSRVTGQAVAGTRVDELANIPEISIDHAYYSGYKTSNFDTVLGSGTTVVNLYYKLTEYTLTFDLNPGTYTERVYHSLWPWDYTDYVRDYIATMNFLGAAYTKSGYNEPDRQYAFTAKVGQDIEHLWPSSAAGSATFTRVGTGSSNAFGGWTTTASGKINGKDESKNVTKRLTLTTDLLYNDSQTLTYYAQWISGKTYTVNYYFERLLHETGGIQYPNRSNRYYVLNDQYSQKFTASSNITLNAKDIEGLKVIYDPDMKNNTKTFYYERNTNNLTFNLMGGTLGNTSLPQVGGKYDPLGTGVGYSKVMYGEQLKHFWNGDLTDKLTLVRDGIEYEFQGWYYDAQYYNPVDLANDTMPNGPLQLYAKWQSMEFTATFYASTLSTEPLAVTYFGADDQVQFPEDYPIGTTVEGRGVLSGWQRYVGSYLRPFAPDTIVKGNINLYATYQTKDFTITYDVQPGIGAPPVDDNTYLLNVEAPVKDLPDGVVKPDGTAFVGWRLKDANDTRTYYPGGTVTVIRNMELFAKYINASEALTLNFDANGGTGTVSTITVERGAEINLPTGNEFTRPNHTLLGWSYNREAVEAEFSPYDLYTVNESTTLYAIWKLDTQTVTFLAGEHGTLVGGPDSVVHTVPHGAEWSTVDVPQVTANEGYYFIGWKPQLPNADELIESPWKFTAEYGKQTDLTITANDDTKPYDGTPLEAGATGFRHSLDGSVNLVITGVQYSGSITEYTADGVPAVIEDAADFKIELDGVDVTEQYKVTFAPGKLTITKVDLEVRVADIEIDYGDPAPVAEDYVISYHGFVNNENDSVLLTRATATTTYQQGYTTGRYPITLSGASARNYAMVYGEADVIVKALGSMEVSAQGFNEMYNGNAHAIKVKVETPNLTGVKIEYSESPDGPWDDHPEYIDAMSTRTLYFRVTADNYQPYIGNVNVTIRQRTITVAAQPAVHAYSGELIEADGYYVTSLIRMVSGHSFDGRVAYGSGTKPDFYPIKIEEKLTIKDRDGNDVTDNYAISKINNVLTITPALPGKNLEWSVEVYGVNRTYNGYTQIVSHPVVPKLPEGYTVTGLVAVTSGKDAGTYDTKLNRTLAAIWDENNVNVTAWFGAPTVTESTLIIKPRPLTIVVDSKITTYGKETPTLTANYIGLALGHKASVLGENYGLTTRYEAGKPAGLYAITTEGITNDNYKVTTIPGVLTVMLSHDLKASAANVIRTYDGQFHSIEVLHEGAAGAKVEYRTSLLGKWTTEPPMYKDAMRTLETKTVYYRVTASGYAPVYGSAIVKINPAKLTIKANSQFVEYGGTPEPFTATFTGFVYGEDENLLGNGFTITSNYVPGNPAGRYDIVPSGASNSNYAIKYIKGKLFVGQPGTLYADAADVEEVYDGNAYGITVEVVADDKIDYVVEYHSDTDTTWTTTLPTFTDVTDGPQTVYYRVTADYYPVIEGSATVEIAQRPITIQAENGPTEPYTGHAIEVTSGVFAPNDGELVTGQVIDGTAKGEGTTVGEHPMVVDADSVTITTSGGEDVKPNYKIIYEKGKFSIVEREINFKELGVTVNEQEKTYGEDDPELTYNWPDDIGFDEADFDIELERDGNEETGEYAITMTITPKTGLEGYTITYPENGKFTINPAELTITVDKVTISYGDPAPRNYSLSYEGFKRSDNVADLDNTFELATNYTQGMDVDTYQIVFDNVTDAKNYKIDYVGGELEVLPREITVKAGSSTMSYTGSLITVDTAGGYLTDGSLLKGQTLTVESLGSGTTAGDHPIRVTDVTITEEVDEEVVDQTHNYTIAKEDGVLTITGGSGGDGGDGGGGRTRPGGSTGDTAGTSSTIITDSQVPLAETPLVSIEDDDVPLEELPDTGGVPVEAFMALGVIMMGGAGMYKIRTGKRYRIKKAD